MLLKHFSVSVLIAFYYLFLFIIQERLWKMTAAAQICHRVALTCQLRFEERNQHKKLKKIASVLSNAILEFWSSVEVPGELEETSLGIVKVLDC